jgi:hypothetical protein
MQVDALLREPPPQQRDSATVRRLTHWLLVHELNAGRGDMDTYMAAQQLQIIATVTASSSAADAWLTMTAHRARTLAEKVDNPLRLRVILPLNELSLHAVNRPLELVSAGCCV